MQIQLESLKKREQPARVAAERFGTIVQQQTGQLKQAELQKLISDLTTQGQKVARFRSFKDLAKYKRMVKKFLKEAVDHGISLKQSHRFLLDGDNRKLMTIEKVDEKLLELTETVMDQEQPSIEILDLIGEIKGMLINLYT